MARMIPVRSRITGLETTVNEKAWPAFAGEYERLDRPPADTDTAGPADPAAPATASPKSTRRTPAPKEEE